MPATTSRKRDFQWGRWALIGCAGWIALMVVIGAPEGIVATPALGPITGWLVGGAFHRATGAFAR